MPHIHEKIDFVADVFIVYKNKVLLRKHDKYKIWLPPGGHIELDEDPNQAAIRETKEEVGLDINLIDSETPIRLFDDSKELIPPRFLNRHKINDSHEHISFIYFAAAKIDLIQQGETEMSDAIRWFANDELDDPKFGIIERIKYYAHAALQALA
jgi:ADP-ribose pyrophosphatase YjhB (NUDIX family)